MKGVVSLALLSLLVCSVGSSTGSHNSHVSLSRAANSKCMWQCTGPNIDGNSSWILQFDFNFYLIFNAETKSIAIFNKQLGYYFVILGGGIIAIVDQNSGAALLINVTINVAFYVKGSGAFVGDLSVVIDLVFKFASDHKGDVSGNVDVNSGFYFRLSALLNIEVELKGRDELISALQKNFGVLITAILKAVSDGLVSSVNGAIRALLYVFILDVKVKIDVVKLLFQILVVVVEGSVEITGELLEKLQKALTDTVENATKALNDLLKAVTGLVSGLFKNIGEALENLGKTIGKAIVAVFQNTFSVVDSTVQGIVTLVLRFDSSWYFGIKDPNVPKRSISVSFDAVTNVLLLVNEETNYALAFNGQGTYYAFINTKTGAVIIVHFQEEGFLIKEKTGKAIILEINAKLAAAFASSSFANVYAIIKQIFEDNKVIKPEFDVENFLAGKGLEGISDQKVRTALQANFAAVIIFKAASQCEYIYFIFGQLNIIQFSSNFVDFLRVIFVRNGGKYNKFLLSIVANQIVVSFQRQFVDGLLGGLVKALVNIIGGLGQLIGGVLNALIEPLAKILNLQTNFNSHAKAEFKIDLSVDIKIKSSVHAVGPKIA